MNHEHATPSTLHRLRVRGRNTAADLASGARTALHVLGDGSVSYDAIGRRLSHPDTGKPLSHAYVGNWFTAASGVAIALGDVLALPKALAREILTRCLASLDDGAGSESIRDTLDLIQIELAQAVDDYRKDLADGREDNREVHVRHLARIATIVMRGLARAQRGTS